ncbi:DPBB-1 domain-containing protein [Favolaschia claudopus]|uniref:DPBB-1 domain-containing protein n=1 Tax=Favolaschia claudopus TaxID=2862362 RepID=A0AAW0DRM2_9AGAR
MLFLLPASALLAFAVLGKSASHGLGGSHLTNLRRHHSVPREPQLAPAVKKLNRRRSCKPPASSSSHSAASTTAKQHSSSPSTPASSLTGGSIAAGVFKAIKPADWPTATHAGAMPSSTVASSHDPYLKALSNALDNSENHFFTETHTGDMTYYGQGLGACGDVYDDDSFTAAISMKMFDNWPGSTGEQNRSPACGPFVPARKALNDAGLMVSVVQSSVPGYALIGGDGLINCLGSGAGKSDAQCHIPLTATVTHGDKSIQVKIVDRCVGCEVGDIDLTPAAFAALADMGLGRTSVTWKFDQW